MIDKLGVAVLVSLFTRSSAYAIIPATQRAAAAAPRFDHFCDSILGQWHCTKDQRNFEVEEIMRSCGGAVQGVREKEGALYHNRADDGFVYFGCGTYSSGPLSLSSEGVKLTTNLCFPSHRQRVTLECTPPAIAGGLWIVNADRNVLSREKAADESSSPGRGNGPPRLNLEHEVGCWMAEGGRMQLNRAKWAQQSASMVMPSDVEHQASRCSSTLIGWDVEWQGDTGLQAWVAVAHREKETQQIWTAWDHAEPKLVIQVGAVCPVTRKTKAVTRSFCSSQGLLNAVVLSQGYYA